MKLNEIDLNKSMAVFHVDMDGMGSFILNKFFNINYTKSISTNYGENFELESLQSGFYNTVIYTDFTPSEICRKAIIENNIKCLIIDHHEGVKEEIEEFCKQYFNVEYIYDNTKSGTKLYYEWLLSQNFKGNDTSDHIVNLIDCYDLYKQDSPLWNEAFKLNTLLYCTGKYYYKEDRFQCFEFFINTMLWKMQNADKFFFNALEVSKINADIEKGNRIFEELIKNSATEISTRQDNRGNYFAIFHCKSKVSDVCNRLLKKYPKLKYVACINDFDKDNPKISLRSVDDFDLLQLCNVKGHKNASGVNSDEVGDMKEFVRKLESKEIYEFGYQD